MVGVLEINKTISKRERFQIWWKQGGKIRSFIALGILAMLILCSGNQLMIGITICLVSLYSFVRLFYNKEHRYFVFAMSVWLLYKGITELLCYFRQAIY